MIRLKEGVELRPEVLKKAVRDAGFTPTWMRLKVVGRLIKNDGGWAIRVKKQEFVLTDGEKLKDVAGREIVVEGELAGDGRTIKVEGVSPH